MNQLNTICLTKRPHKYLTADPVKTAIDLRDKTILVVDDFCTSGKSNEAARMYIEAAGGRARLFSWLKTISVPYTRINAPLQLMPFTGTQLAAEPTSQDYGHAENIIAPDAPAEIHQIFMRYRDWRWD